MTAAVVLAAYLSLLVELVAFPVPSSASTSSVFRSDEFSLAIKTVIFGLPWLLCVIFFLLPLGMIFVPELRSALGPIRSLEGPVVVAAGLALVVLGRILTFSSVLAMRGHDAALFRSAIPTELRRSRLFTRSRNPGLVGMFFFYLGLVLVFPCWALVLGVPVYFTNMHVRVLMEENDLSSRFGAVYAAYRDETRRYL